MERKDNLSGSLALEGFCASPAWHTFSLTKFPQLTLCKMSMEIVPAYRISAQVIIGRGTSLMQKDRYDILSFVYTNVSVVGRNVCFVKKPANLILY